MFIHYDELDKFLEDAVSHYERSAPTVADYCDDLYRRSHQAPQSVSLAELAGVQNLQEQGEWITPHFAVNRVYHLMHRLGMDVAGHLGF